MKKFIVPIIRLVVLLAYTAAAQSVISQAIAYKNETFHVIPTMLCIAVVSILMGALLRSDVFLKRPVAFHPDWPNLLIIGIPTLLLTFGNCLLMVFFSNVELPGFVGTLLFQNYTPVFFGIIFGYTLINSMFGGGSLPGPSHVSK